MMSEDTGQDNTPANQAEVHLYYLLTYTVCVCVGHMCECWSVCMGLVIEPVKCTVKRFVPCVSREGN